ncbi:MAG: SAP domain-containing protein [Sedimenticola sp.]
MNIKEIRKIAREHGLETAKLKQDELIRAIQIAEGNFDCFGSCREQYCDQSECLWRADCLE